MCDSEQQTSARKAKLLRVFALLQNTSGNHKEADLTSSARPTITPMILVAPVSLKLKSLDEVGIKHSGRPSDVASSEVNGLRVGMIAFHTTRSAHYINDHETAKKTFVANLASNHDIVIVSFHGGAEGNKALHLPKGRETFYGENRGNSRVFARDVIDAGADLVLGHGPHVLRGMEVYNNRLVDLFHGELCRYGRFSLWKQKGSIIIVEVNMIQKRILGENRFQQN